MHYNLNRYYDPNAGRFIHQDPVGLKGGANVYRYAPNPVNWVDPLGLTGKDCSGGRLPQDVNVNPTPPAVLPTNRPIGRSPTQNAAAQAEVQRMQQAGYRDIRVNQQQVNAEGVRVGTNRPDVQETSPAGQREYIEFDTSSSTRGPAHEVRIRANDPSGSVDLRTQN
ncbi:RHS repeat-associated core domain-containing protein [Methylomonas sp. BW4-1]|uniref:RHS repeat-associated core domain-containing protein n=1 Tax=Methylomonas sp. BW4-1 TaxID=3376685 RepID=UPI0040415103